MLGTFKSVATAAVKDIDAAKRFYTDKLGLKQIGSEGQEAVTYQTGGDTTLLVYRSQYAGQNGATGVTWNVENIHDVVRDLKAKGVRITQEPDPQPWGTYMMILDEDDNGLLLVQPPR